MIFVMFDKMITAATPYSNGFYYNLMLNFENLS